MDQLLWFCHAMTLLSDSWPAIFGQFWLHLYADHGRLHALHALLCHSRTSPDSGLLGHILQNLLSSGLSVKHGHQVGLVCLVASETTLHWARWAFQFHPHRWTLHKSVRQLHQSNCTIVLSKADERTTVMGSHAVDGAIMRIHLDTRFLIFLIN